VDVGDVAEAVLRCVEQPTPKGVTLNVGSGLPVSIMAVARLLARLMESAVEPQVTGEYRIGDIRHNCADVSRLENVSGFRPTIALEVGLERFVRWVEAQPIPEDLLDRANAELKARKLMA
jgi:dTDP-L-rhamnose 4-epimerase